VPWTAEKKCAVYAKRLLESEFFRQVAIKLLGVKYRHSVKEGPAISDGKIRLSQGNPLFSLLWKENSKMHFYIPRL
jgi:hypothetical protein